MPYVRFCVKFYLFVYSDILGTASSQQAKLLKVELGSMWYNTQLIIQLTLWTRYGRRALSAVFWFDNVVN